MILISPIFDGFEDSLEAILGWWKDLIDAGYSTRGYGIEATTGGPARSYPVRIPLSFTDIAADYAEPMDDGSYLIFNTETGFMTLENPE